MIQNNDNNILSCGDDLYELLLEMEDISFKKEIDLFVLSASWNKIKNSLSNKTNYVTTFEEKTFEITYEQIQESLEFYTSCFYLSELSINFYFTKDGKFFDTKAALPKYMSITDLNMFLFVSNFYKKFHRLVNNVTIEEEYKFLEVKIKFLEIIINTANAKLFWNYPNITVEQLKNVYEHFITNENVVDKKVVYMGINEHKEVIDAYYHDILPSDSTAEKIKPLQIVFL